MENIEIAKILNQIADILEIQGEMRFRIGAYRRAAQTIEALPTDINVVYKQGKLEEIPGIGKSMAQKIEELIKTGKLKQFEKLKKQVPSGVVEMMEVEGVGPKLAQLVFKKFKVKNINQLEKLVKSHKLLKLKGFKEKTEENILRGIELYRKYGERMLIGKADPLVEYMVGVLKKSKLCEQIEPSGSFRRRKETIGDIDILVTSKRAKEVSDLFCSLDIVKEVVVKGRTKSTVILKTGVEADVRVVDPKCFGAALQYFTGSKAHNIRIRERAVRKGLKINEYGVFKISQKSPYHKGTGQAKVKSQKFRRIAGKTEEEVYKTVGLPWMPPEIREDRGEIEAAEKNKLPKLIELKDIKGDLHVHTRWSDGGNSIEEMAKEAIKRGYQYIAITDHASPLGIIKGIAGKKVLAQLREIEKLRKKFATAKTRKKAKSQNFTILSGVEVDILPNGKLYVPDEILKKLDIVIAAVHSKFKMSEKEMTERILKAVRNPYVHIIAHPTGRVLGKREPYPLNMDKLMDECKKTGTILELNAFWDRLDLNDINCRKAKDFGIKIHIGTDAHNIMELEIMKYGVAQARRGWIEKKDVINTLPLEKLRKILK